MPREALGCAHAAADQPRRAVPRAGERAPDRPRRQSGDARPVDRAGGSFGCAEVKQLLAERGAQLPPLRWRLAEVPFGLDYPYWVEEAEIDLGYHVREMALASPGTDQQLADQVARIMSRPLDRARPLWELYVIEGTSPGSWRADEDPPRGDRRPSGAEIMALLLDLTPEGREVAARGRGSRGPAAERGCRCSRSGCSASRATRCGCCARCRRRSRTSTTRRSASSPAPARCRRWRAARRRDGGPAARAPRRAPKTKFSGRISPHRRFVFGQLPLERLQGGQERARRDGQRRRGLDLRGRGAALADRARRPAGRRRSWRRSRSRCARTSSSAPTATGILLMAAPLFTDEPTRSSGCARPTRRWPR